MRQGHICSLLLALFSASCNPSPSFEPYNPNSTAVQIEKSGRRVPVRFDDEEAAEYLSLSDLMISTSSESDGSQKTVSARIEVDVQPLRWELNFVKDGEVYFRTKKTTIEGNFDFFLDLRELCSREDIEIPDEIRVRLLK